MSFPLDCDTTVEEKKEKLSIKKEVRAKVKEIYLDYLTQETTYKGTKEVIVKLKEGSFSLPSEDLPLFRIMLNSRIEAQRNFTPFSILVAITCMGTAASITWIVNSVKINSFMIDHSIPRITLHIGILLFILFALCVTFYLVASYYRALTSMLFVKEVVDAAITQLNTDTKANIQQHFTAIDSPSSSCVNPDPEAHRSV